jgi:hypothetical protein
MNVDVQALPLAESNDKLLIFRVDGMEIGRCHQTSEGVVPIGQKYPVPPDQLAEALVRATLADARKRKREAENDEARALSLLRTIRR